MFNNRWLGFLILATVELLIFAGCDKTSDSTDVNDDTAYNDIATGQDSNSADFNEITDLFIDSASDLQVDPFFDPFVAEPDENNLDLTIDSDLAIAMDTSTASGDTAIGQACSENNPCAEEQFCLDHIGEGDNPWIFPNGYCTQLCDQSNSSSCPVDSRCDDFAYLGYPPINDYYICTALCQTNEECRASEGYICDMGSCIYFE